MPIVSEAHRESRRQQILDAFVACVAREGFHRTTMAAVIKEAGLSAGAVYGYFRSKTEMIRAVAERNLGRATDQLRALAEADGTMTPSRVLESFVGSPLEDYGAESPRISVQVWAEAARDSEVATMVAERLANLRTVLTELVRRCQADATIDESAEPEKVALVLVGLLPGYLLQRFLLPDLSPDAYLAGALELIGSGDPGRRSG